MGEIGDWLDDLEANNALLVPRDRAYEVCTDIIDRNHSNRTTEAARNSNSTSRIIPGDSSPPRPIVLVVSVLKRLLRTEAKAALNTSKRVSGSHCAVSRPPPVRTLLVVVPMRVLQLLRQRMLKVAPLVATEDTERKRKIDALIRTAKNDETFLVICMLFDEELSTEFGLFAGVYLEGHRRRGVQPSKLMREVLLFSYWRRFGAGNREEHESRERTLRATMQLMGEARICIGLKVYRDMRWRFL